MLDTSLFSSLDEKRGDEYRYGGGATPEDDFSKWSCVYPHHIDSGRTCAEGRRISRADAVVLPSIDQLADACEKTGIPYVAERWKRYPRDWFIQGRLRVKLDRGIPRNEFLRVLAKEVSAAAVTPQAKAASKTVKAAVRQPTAAAGRKNGRKGR